MLLRLSDEEYGLLARASEGSGLTPTGFAAEAALATARGRELPEHGPLRVALVEYMTSRTQLRRAGVNLNQAVALLHVAEDPAAFAAIAERVERVAEAVERAVERNDATATAVAAILLRGRR